MSVVLTSLCSALLKDRFGETVEEVGTFLLKYLSSCPLHVIVKKISIPLDKIKSALEVLIHHGFCTFVQDEKGIVEYGIKHEDVLLLLHYENYAYFAQMLCGDLADLLVTEIVHNGRLTMSKTLQSVLERLEDTKDASGVDYSLKTVHEKFVQLVERHFLIRCPYSHSFSNENMPNLSISEQELFLVPQIQLNVLESSLSEEPTPKKRKREYPDKSIYWRVNHDKYIECFRNESIIQACCDQMGEKEAEVVRIILTLSENKSNPLSPTTHPVTYHDILGKISQAAHIKSHELDSYLSFLCDGSQNFVSKADDRSEGMFVVNVSKVLQRLLQSTLANAVRDRFGSNCAKIFRILLDKKVLEPKQIEEVSVLHPKDTKEFIYKMFEEGFIVSHEVPRGSDFSYSQTVYLLKVDLIQVCQMLMEHCYKALHNLLIISEIQNGKNKRLLEKKQRIDAIEASLRQNGAEEEQIEEVLNVITPPEAAVIKKVARCSKKIDSAQQKLAEDILFFSVWLDFLRCNKSV